MKPSELKSFIKEAVREAIQEELKDILLEAVRAPKAPIQEAYQMPPVTVNANAAQTPSKTATEKRAMMESIMGDMRRGQDTLNFTTQNIATNTLQVAPGMDTIGDGSRLPEGNVGLDMIQSLLKGSK
tara:strand:+ start:305 stop:685 length:381 start_codon:yes stop_codon:yes gene_type:complete